MDRPRLFARRAAAVTLAGCLLTLIAFVFDASPLFVPGVALVGIGLAAPIWVWFTARGADAQRVLSTERVVEEQPLEASIEVRRGWLGLGGWARLEVVDPFTASRLELSGPLSPIRGGRTAHVRVVARFPRRGMQSLPAPSLVVSDPLELARVETESAAPPQRLLVLPRTEAVRWLASDAGRRFDQPDGDAFAEAQAAVDMDGLRPYRVGTPASRIHWPAVARGHGLIERRLRADGDSRPLVVLDARMPEAGSHPELLDAAVRATASLVLDLARRGGCGLLLPGEQRPTAVDRELIAWPAAYARLALVQSDGTSRAPALGPATSRLGATIYVAPAPTPRVTALLTAPGNGLVVLVVPHQQLTSGRPSGARGRMLATLDVSGCRGFRLGAQRDRPRTEPETVAR
ncbi:MAG: DUF58 domain-containing protein [Solirubrobacteraceae bacterium]